MDDPIFMLHNPTALRIHLFLQHLNWDNLLQLYFSPPNPFTAYSNSVTIRITGQSFHLLQNITPPLIVL